MGWGMLWLFVVLKIPIAALCLLVWWAIKQEPEDTPGGDGGQRVDKTPAHPRPPLPRAPRRGPHGDGALPSPPRVRAIDARARTSEHLIP